MDIRQLIQQLPEPGKPTPQVDIPASLAEKLLRFDWRFQVYTPAVAPIREAGLEFAAHVIMGLPKRWVSFLGPSGIGKTLMSRDVLRFLEKHWTRIVTKRHEDGTTSGRTPQIARVVPAKDLDTYSAAREYAEKFDLVYVEDIGAGQFGDKGAGAVTKARLAELLQLRTGKWTILDANLYRGEIAEAIDPRISSRLKRDGSVCVEVSPDTPDFNA